MRKRLNCEKFYAFKFELKFNTCIISAIYSCGEREEEVSLD